MANFECLVESGAGFLSLVRPSRTGHSPKLVHHHARRWTSTGHWRDGPTQSSFGSDIMVEPFHYTDQEVEEQRREGTRPPLESILSIWWAHDTAKDEKWRGRAARGT